MTVLVPVAVDVGGETDAVAIVDEEGADEINPESIKVGVSSTEMRLVEMKSAEMIVSSIEMICLKVLSISSLAIVTISKLCLIAGWLTGLINAMTVATDSEH